MVLPFHHVNAIPPLTAHSHLNFRSIHSLSELEFHFYSYAHSHTATRFSGCLFCCAHTYRSHHLFGLVLTFVNDYIKMIIKMIGVMMSFQIIIFLVHTHSRRNCSIRNPFIKKYEIFTKLSDLWHCSGKNGAEREKKTQNIWKNSTDAQAS